MLSEIRDVARGVVLGLLVCAGILGLFADVWAILALSSERSADGLGNEVALLAFVVFLPFQLGAAFVVRRALQRRKLEQRRFAHLPLAVEPLPFATISAAVLNGVDDNVFERERAKRVVRWAQWLLGLPAAAIALAASAHFLGLRSVYFTLTEPMSLLWLPSWGAGAVAAVIALARYDQWRPLALALLYPALSFVYGLA